VAGSPADSQSVNRYLYCAASPIGGLDPSGHELGTGDFFFEAALVVIGAVISVVCIPEAVAGLALGKGVQLLLVLTYEAIVHLVGYIVKYTWEHPGVDNGYDGPGIKWGWAKPQGKNYFRAP